MREVIVRTNQEVSVPIEEFYELRKDAFQEYTDQGLYTAVQQTTIEQFQLQLKGKSVFLAQDEATGELLGMHTLRLNRRRGSAKGEDLGVSPKAQHEGIASRMLQTEAQRLRKAGYRYMVGSTAIPATWSVQWHLKNGYRIVGYSRSEKRNYPIYIFRKQIATDVRHHPTDLLWTRPLAPITAKIRYWATWMATMVCKDKAGKLNWLGRMTKKLKASIR